jgi:NAD(P)-dependent dehydrogenase (short-subunit alcohol dehydrogenase family)
MAAAAHNSTIDLSGQVALITGGSGGLGRAFALTLAAAGAKVAVMARTQPGLAEIVALIERAGGRALPLAGDVARAPDVARAVGTAEHHLGSVDILVNSAGSPIARSFGYDWNVDPQAWWDTFEINMRGPFLCARAVLPGMIQRGRGRIVNVSSRAAFTALPQMDALCASKAALTHWTRCVAAGTQAHGIALFALSPGVVRTPATERLAAAPEVPKEVSERYRALFSQKLDTPVARVAQKVLFLVSGKADALSGRFIQVEDDEDDLVRRAEEIRRDDLHILALRK